MTFLAINYRACVKCHLQGVHLWKVELFFKVPLILVISIEDEVISLSLSLSYWVVAIYRLFSKGNQILVMVCFQAYG